MRRQTDLALLPSLWLFFGCLLALLSHEAGAADRLVGAPSAQVLSQSMPWIGQEAGLFKK